MEIAIIIFAAILNAVLCLAAAKRLTHFLQQNNYGVRAYFKNYRRNFFFIRYQYIAGVTGILIFALFWFLLPRGGYGLFYLLGLIPYFIMLAALAFVTLRVKTKKPLSATRRMKRLFATLFFLCLIFNLLSLIFLSLLAPLAAILNAPFENKVNNGYIKAAKRKLEGMTGLVKIGITGSYGKTSVKLYLAEMLKAKYKVCASPQSYNTPLGIARVINNTLKPDDEILIAEMGARHNGDIKFLCGMVKPSIGILTAIGAQHLETFKCIGNIIAAKYELIENLCQGDAVPDTKTTAVFNCDSEYVKLLHERTCQRGVNRIISAGADKKNDVYYTVAGADAEGSAFSLYIGGEKLDCRTRLLGRHNIGNICAAAAAAHYLGVSGDEIAKAVSRLEPAVHRLQLLKGQGGITVIDDAYNSNPSGARAALDALAMFPGRKIIVTPGLVELGGAQYSENRGLGTYIAERADYCFAIGENAAAIKDGFAGAVVCADLAEAQARLAQIIKPGDTVLFENDLPDI